MKKILRLIIGFLVIFGLFSFIYWQLKVFKEPRTPEYTSAQTRAVQKLALEVSDVLKEDLKEGTRVGMHHFSADPSGQATRIFKESLADTGHWNVEEKTVLKKIMGDLWKALAKAETKDEILSAAQKVELDVLISGSVISVESVGEEGARAKFDLHVYGLGRGVWLMQKPVEVTWQPTAVDKLVELVEGTGKTKRIAIWFIFVLLVPWLTMFATQWALTQKTNRSSFIILSFYTVVDLALALVLSGFKLIGAGMALWFLGAFLISAAYNYWACEKIAGMK